MRSNCVSGSALLIHNNSLFLFLFFFFTLNGAKTNNELSSLAPKSPTVAYLVEGAMYGDSKEVLKKQGTKMLPH